MALHQFIREQHFSHPVATLWEFISDPHNLKRITPPYLGFDIRTPDLPERMYAGMLIEYRVSPLLGIPTPWVTEITQMREPYYFIDEQRKGPYRLWHHQHFLEATEAGTRMRDIVSYIPPFGLLGEVADRFIIQKKLREIFAYRKMVLEGIF